MSFLYADEAREDLSFTPRGYCRSQFIDALVLYHIEAQ